MFLCVKISKTYFLKRMVSKYISKTQKNVSKKKPKKSKWYRVFVKPDKCENRDSYEL